MGTPTLEVFIPFSLKLVYPGKFSFVTHHAENSVPTRFQQITVGAASQWNAWYELSKTATKVLKYNICMLSDWTTTFDFWCNNLIQSETDLSNMHQASWPVHDPQFHFKNMINSLFSLPRTLQVIYYLTAHGAGGLKFILQPWILPT